jgi:hypothetical protein
MQCLRPCFYSAGLLGVFLVLAGCTYETAIRRLSLPEQTEFRTYSKVMTSAQVRKYLAQATPAERTAYLRGVGLVQRFEALDPLDREAILGGQPRQGMSAAALRFLWGQPYYTQGRVNYYEHWYYLGSSLTLAASGNDYHTYGSQVVVHLTAGRITGWLDFVPHFNDSSGNDGGDCVGGC